MPLARGFSRAVVSENISQEMRSGRSQAQSVAIALSSARRSYRSRHPVGPFPKHLRMSATYRASRSMNRAGAPALTPPTMVSSLIDLGVRPDATVFYSVKQGFLHASEREVSGRIGRPRKLAWARVPGYDPNLFYYVEKGLLYASARSSRSPGSSRNRTGGGSSFHVYADDGFESAHRTQTAADRAAKAGSARRRGVRYYVVEVLPGGYSGGTGRSAVSEWFNGRDARSSSVASQHEARIAREDAGMPRAMRDVMSPSRNRVGSLNMVKWSREKRVITLGRRDTKRWEDGGSDGHEFRRRVREMAHAQADRSGRSVEIYASASAGGWMADQILPGR